MSLAATLLSQMTVKPIYNVFSNPNQIVLLPKPNHRRFTMLPTCYNVNDTQTFCVKILRKRLPTIMTPGLLPKQNKINPIILLSVH